jgi:hypothetical protein
VASYIGRDAMDCLEFALGLVVGFNPVSGLNRSLRSLIVHTYIQ